MATCPLCSEIRRSKSYSDRINRIELIAAYLRLGLAASGKGGAAMNAVNRAIEFDDHIDPRLVFLHRAHS